MARIGSWSLDFLLKQYREIFTMRFPRQKLTSNRVFTAAMILLAVCELNFTDRRCRELLQKAPYAHCVRIGFLYYDELYFLFFFILEKRN